MRPQESPESGLLAGLFAASVRTETATLEYGRPDLRPGERRLIERAVESRQREFATGRVVARRLLTELGFPGFELLRDDDRVPIWPTSVVGSISHTAHRCVVAVTRDPEIIGLGLDIERDTPTKTGLERRICTARERAWLAESGDPDERGRRCKLVFSAKEAVYKSFFPRLREFWGFQSVELDVDLETGCFEAALPASSGRATIPGRFRRREGFLVTAVTVR